MDSKENKRGFGAWLERFVAGRGYTVTMVLCAVVIAASLFALLRTPETQEPDAAASTVVAPVPVELPVSEPTTEPDAAEPSAEAAEPTEQPADETTVTLLDAAETGAQDIFVLPVNGTLQRDYSVTALSYDATMRDWRTHDGVDIAAGAGEKVYAAASGTVTEVFFDDLYGTTVTIDHGDGLVFTYSGLQEIPTVYAGDTVAAGDVIGAVGKTCVCESAQETHLHLSAKRGGESVSPTDYLPAFG